MTGYDGRGQIQGQSWTFPAGVGFTLIPTTFKTSYTYDQAGRRTSIRYPDRVIGQEPETITTSYDALGYPTRLTGVQTPLLGGPKTVQYTSDTGYAADGKLLRRSYANPSYPLTRQYGYETDTQRLSTVSTLVGDPIQAGTTARQADTYTYTYDDAGNITSIRDDSKSLNPLVDVPTATCFDYDTLNRLRHAWSTKQTNCSDGASTTVHDGPSGFNQSWTYSADGNVTSARSLLVNRTFSYNDSNHPHAVTTAGLDVYGYDANGQQNTRLKTAVPGVLTYTPLRQLESVTAGVKNTRFVYGADGSRMARFNPDGTATLYIDGQEISVVKGIASAIRYYDQNGTIVAKRIQTGSLLWQLNDNQGSAQGWMLSGTGLLKRTYYDPYGRIRDLSVQPATDRGFLGKTNDPFTGLDALGARAYDPDLGRFVSPDPLVDLRSAQTANAYSYAANNPIAYSDPTGLISVPGWNTLKSTASSVKDFGVGAAEGVASIGVGLFRAGESSVYVTAAYNPTSPLFWFVKTVNPAYHKQLQAQVAQQYSIFAHPNELWDAVTQDVREDWNNGRKSEASGRATVDIVTLLFPFTKASKLGLAGRTAKVTEEAGEAAAKGITVDLSTAGRSADEAAGLSEYARRTNIWLADNGPQVIQSTKGPLRTQANASARAERLRALRAGTPYRGQAGHVPDTAISGMPNPPAGWLDMVGVSNSAAGGVLGSRVGQLLARFTVDGLEP